MLSNRKFIATEKCDRSRQTGTHNQFKFILNNYLRLSAYLQNNFLAFEANISFFDKFVSLVFAN